MLYTSSPYNVLYF